MEARVDTKKIRMTLAREKGHLMTGLSYMIPTIVGSSLAVAVPKLIALAMGVPDLGNFKDGDGFFHALYLIQNVGNYGISTLINVVLAGFIAYSIADKPAIGAGFIGGFAAVQNGSGFLGALLAGFLAGHIVEFVKNHLHLPKALETIEPIVILPFVGTLSVAIVMGWLLAAPLSAINGALVSWIKVMSESGTSKVILAAVLGAMIAFDMGGPVNKAAVMACNALVAEGIFTPKVYMKVAISIPTLGYALAATIWKKRFSPGLRDAGISCWIMGFIGITEGAIPFALTRPSRLIPLNVIAGAAGAAVSAILGAATTIPPLSGIYGAILTVTINPLAALAGMAVGMLIIAVFAPLLADFTEAEGEEDISEEDIDIAFE